jgi:2-amino-4-hydroxy-6-hydroxymethyldihydropteridine diphosphokinase
VSRPETGRRVAFALGANLGDPLGALRVAATRLASALEHPRVSAVYATPPEGDMPQPPYLNAVLVGEGVLGPGEALALARELEREAGRERPYPGAPRTLDVDVLFVGDAVVDTPSLRIPHPRWRTRDFVVVPLLDVAPDLRDPESGDRVRDVARSAGWGPGRFPEVLERGGLLTPKEGA